MAALKVLFSTLLGLTVISNAVCSQKVMVILLDGFRWDYFDIHGAGLRGFPRMFQLGTKAEHTVMDFPTSSYPNLYTIMTGLHVENHGMVNTYMYDEPHDSFFLAGYNADYNQSYWWDGGDPLWITATRQGKSAYMYYWPNCEVTIRGLLPKYCRRFMRMETMEELRTAMVDGLSAFENEGADLVGIYSELSDYIAHRYGPRSAEMRQLVWDLDDAIYMLHSELEKRHLEDKVNVIIVSDHGHTEISPKRVLKVEDYIDVTDVHRFLEGGALLCIWPKEGKLDKPNQTFRYYDEVDIVKSDHGYDNRLQDMWGIFVASGPSFKSSFVSDPIRGVDMYQVMCNILGITPSRHDGIWSNVENMLYRHTSAAPAHILSYWLIICLILLNFNLVKH